MTDKLKYNEFRFGNVFHEAFNFSVTFATFVYEVSQIIDCFFLKELAPTAPSFVLYIGTLLSIFLNELVYDSVADSHPRIHRVLVLSSLIGSLVSFFAIMVSSGMESLPNLKFWVLHISRCIVVFSFGVVCGSCLGKTIVLWNESGENDDLNLDIGGNLSDFDVDSSISIRKGD